MPGAKLPTALIHDAKYMEHITGRGHPERPERYRAVMDALEREKLLPGLLQLQPAAAVEEDILLAHTKEYFETAQRDINSGASMLSTGDTHVCAKSFDVAMLAAGAAIEAVDAVCGDKAANAFCVVRPPGHHANAERGMGFCVFNNVAIAARYARSEFGIGRVLIADWDVHHGNGTQDIFYEDPSVFFFSTHQAPLYPGTGRSSERGAGAGTGFTLNCPFPAGSGRREIFGAFTDQLIPAMQHFKPELIILSAGFDSRIDDPLGGFTLTDDDFHDLTRLMLDLADKHCGGRLISMLEGGYNLDGLGKAAAAHVKALMR